MKKPNSNTEIPGSDNLLSRSSLILAGNLRRSRQWKWSSSIQRFFRLSICAVVAGIALAAVDPPRTVPLDGTFGTTFKLIPTATPGVFDDPIEGVGSVPTLGFCTIVVQQ